MKKTLLSLFMVFFAMGPLAYADIQTTEVTYESDGVTLKGFLTFDDSIKEQRPGILVVHEWWGHNDYARKRARMLAELGYTALAVDMYGDGKRADHPDTAGKFAGEVGKNMQTIGKARFLAALDVLQKHPTVDPENVAAIGYCFGGGTVLHMARFGVDIKGVVSFHGSLTTSTPAQPHEVKARVLVCHGEDDTFVAPEHIVEFEQEMENAGVNYEFISYEGAVHSFTSPKADELGEKFGLPLAYNEAADKKSWQDMLSFFNALFESED